MIHPSSVISKNAKIDQSSNIGPYCVIGDGVEIGKNNNLISIEEKPNNPKSEFGILPLYYFRPEIFQSLKKIKTGKGGEFQLTDAIQNLIHHNHKVLAIKLEKHEKEVDVGTVESYRDSQRISLERA